MKYSTRKPSDGLIEALQEAAGEPSGVNVDRVHEEMLLDFIKNSRGLTGMILIGIHGTGASSENVEVYAGANKSSIFRAAGALVNVASEAARKDGEHEFADNIDNITKLLMTLGGSSDLELADEIDVSSLAKGVRH